MIDPHFDQRESNSCSFLHITNCHFSIVRCGQDGDLNVGFLQSCPDTLGSFAEIQGRFESCGWLGYNMMAAAVLAQSSAKDCS